MKKKILLSLSVISMLMLNACSSVTVKEQAEFIKVNGSMFQGGNKPYYFSGTNFWYGCYLGSKGELGDRERLIRELDNMKSMGITNLRILAASEESDLKNSLKPAIQMKPGVYDEDLLEGLDFLLSEMGKRKMYAVVFLNNFWEWSGGMSQYKAWATGEKVFNPDDPGKGWGQFMNNSASFYKDAKANELFRNYIKNIVTRKNKFSGLLYSDDPAIMAWQLANEPRPGEGQYALDNKEVYYKWIDETAGYIHSLDKNHLVTSGSEGYMGSAQSEEIYLNAHRSRNIDYITFHLWAKNWGWFDAKKIDETFQPAVEKATAYIRQHIELARQLNKPVTMEEFGLARDNEVLDANAPKTARDKYYSALLNLVYDSAKTGSPMAGTNFWAWGGEGRGKNPDGQWRKGDPLTGDPWQEPQGYNSIFNSDTSTIQILSDYGRRMQELCK